MTAPRFPKSPFHPSGCGKSPALSSSCPEEWPVSRDSVPCQKLVQFSLCPHLAYLLFSAISGCHCIAIPRLILRACAWSPTQPPSCRQLLGPHGCYGERMHKCMGEHMLLSERELVLVKLRLYYPKPGKDQMLCQNNHLSNPLWAYVGSSL